MGALYKGFIVTAITSLIILYPVTSNIVGITETYSIDEKTFNGMDLYICGIVGFVITGLLIWITEYYTGTNYRPVKTVAQSSTTGHGTNVIQGLAISMEATAIPALIIVAGILYTNELAGLFGIAIAVTSMLALTGMVVALDAYGPVTDNAGIGGMLPYLFGSMGMQAVGRAGGAVVVEVRRQFKKIPGIMKGKRKPDYGRLVDLLTKAAIKEMIIPSLLPVLSPVVVYFIILQIGGLEAALSSLGAMLLGVIITGLFVAVSMTAGGGAWDNAKKYIEFFYKTFFA